MWGRKREVALSEQCECGHPREAHEHYRRGTECAICDIRQCSEFHGVAVPQYTKA